MEKSNEEKWGELLQEMRDSGKSQTKWCEEQGINFHTFKYWMKKLSQKSKHVEGQPIDKETKWLKLATKQDDDVMHHVTDKIEVCIGNYRIVVPENFSKESMTSLIEVLIKI